MAAMRARASMTTTRIMRLTNISLLLRDLTPTHHESQQGSKEEENTIHDAESKRGLEHSARFINIEPHAIEGSGAKDAERDAVRAVGFQRRTVCAADAAQVVDASYEGAYEAEVHKGHEIGV